MAPSNNISCLLVTTCVSVSIAGISFCEAFSRPTSNTTAAADLCLEQKAKIYCSRPFETDAGHLAFFPFSFRFPVATMEKGERRSFNSSHWIKRLFRGGKLRHHLVQIEVKREWGFIRYQRQKYSVSVSECVKMYTERERERKSWVGLIPERQK